jgi:hypothetical protein
LEEIIGVADGTLPGSADGVRSLVQLFKVGLVYFALVFGTGLVLGYFVCFG